MSRQSSEDEGTKEVKRNKMKDCLKKGLLIA